MYTWKMTYFPSSVLLPYTKVTPLSPQPLSSRFLNCMQKVVTYVVLSWELRFKNPKTIILTRYTTLHSFFSKKITGEENPHLVEKLSWGKRRAISFFFTCYKHYSIYSRTNNNWSLHATNTTPFTPKHSTTDLYMLQTLLNILQITQEFNIRYQSKNGLMLKDLVLNPRAYICYQFLQYSIL